MALLRSGLAAAVSTTAVIGVSIALAAATDSSAAEWLAAVGTVGAVGVALWIALEDRWRLPRLEVVTGGQSPWWVVRSKDAATGPSNYYLRLQIVNVSDFAAQNVVVRCDLFQVGHVVPEGGFDWELPDLITGATLAWYEAGTLSASQTAIDLPAGASRYVCLFLIKDGHAKVMPLGPQRGPGDAYRAVISVTADHMDPLRAGITLDQTTPHDPVVGIGRPDLESDPYRDPGRTKRVTFRG